MKGKLTTYSSDIALVLLGLPFLQGMNYSTIITVTTIALAILDIKYPRYSEKLVEVLNETHGAEEDCDEVDEDSA